MRRTGMNILSEYQLQLSGFEGPLDVLLTLIEQRQLDISELSLVNVTDGFIDYIARLDDCPPQLLAEFARVAARLLVLKSRALLPVSVDEPIEEEVADLAAQLRDYRQAKLLAGRLRIAEQSEYRSFQRGSVPNGRSMNIIVQLPSLDRLRCAFDGVVTRQLQKQDVAAMKRFISVAEMSRRLMRRLLSQRTSLRFSQFVHSAGRNEQIASFIAVLSLVSSRQIVTRQKNLFSDIYLSIKRGALSKAELS
jgi:segregation and condensation protein A